MHSEVNINSGANVAHPGEPTKTRLLSTGEYFFELDDESILPGYPKLIKDAWGIPGPIDAAFTRINCHGKSYIFKVNVSVTGKYLNYLMF